MANEESDALSQGDVDRAMRAAARRLTRSGTPRQNRSRRLRGQTTYSDSRDPAPVSVVMDQFLADRGWQRESAAATLGHLWPEVVGPEVAAHVQPASFEEGVLVVKADSTAWATQVRLLLPSLHKAIAEAVGPDVVGKILVEGPAAPSWTSGQRRVKGRGPRDTYG